MNKPQIYSSIVTIVIAALIVLLLMFIYMPFNKEQEEEGIMISFGDGIEGLGELVPPVVIMHCTFRYFPISLIVDEVWRASSLVGTNIRA